MTSLEKFKAFSGTPTMLIYNGLNPVGVEIIKSMIEHEGFCIVVDSYTEKTKYHYSDFFNNPRFLLVEKNSLGALQDNVKRVDYVVFFLGLDQRSSKNVESNDFLSGTNTLTELMLISKKFNSKFGLITSISSYQITQSRKFQSIESVSTTYTFAELQKYSETLVYDFANKSDLDFRIIRLGEFLGKAILLDNNSDFLYIAKSAISGNKIKVYGDGLDYNYFVNISDASVGIVKGLFNKITKGKTYNLAFPEGLTSLELAYRVQDLEPRSGSIEFVKNHNDTPKPKVNIDIEILKELSWSPKYSLERCLGITLDYMTDELSKVWDYGVNEYDDSQVRKSKRRARYEYTDLEVDILDQNNYVVDLNKEVELKEKESIASPNQDISDEKFFVNDKYKKTEVNILDKNNIRSVSLADKLKELSISSSFVSKYLSFISVSLIIIAMLIVYFVGIPIIKKNQAYDIISNVLLKHQPLSNSDLNSVENGIKDLNQLGSNSFINYFSSLPNTSELDNYNALQLHLININNINSRAKIIEKDFTKIAPSKDADYLDVYGKNNTVTGRFYLRNSEVITIKDQYNNLLKISEQDSKIKQKILDFLNSEKLIYTFLN